MKKILLIIGTIILGIAGIVALVFQLTQPVVQAGDEFFAFVKQDKIADAYESTARDFQSVMSLEQLEYFLKSTGLDRYESSFWTNRSIRNNTGKLAGSIKTSDQRDIPLEISFLLEDGRWKILNIKTEGGTGTDLKSVKNVPKDEDLKKLVKETMILFDKAIKAGNFNQFSKENILSDLWKSQAKPEDLNQAFKAIIEKKVDAAYVANVEPVFSEEPFIDEDEVLQLKGYFPSEKIVTFFELDYIYEHPQWKLIRIKVDYKSE